MDVMTKNRCKTNLSIFACFVCGMVLPSIVIIPSTLEPTHFAPLSRVWRSGLQLCLLFAFATCRPLLIVWLWQSWEQYCAFVSVAEWAVLWMQSMLVFTLFRLFSVFICSAIGTLLRSFEYKSWHEYLWQSAGFSLWSNDQGHGGHDRRQSDPAMGEFPTFLGLEQVFAARNAWLRVLPELLGNPSTVHTFLRCSCKQLGMFDSKPASLV